MGGRTMTGRQPEPAPRTADARRGDAERTPARAEPWDRIGWHPDHVRDRHQPAATRTRPRPPPLPAGSIPSRPEHRREATHSRARTRGRAMNRPPHPRLLPDDGIIDPVAVQVAASGTPAAPLTPPQRQPPAPPLP